MINKLKAMGWAVVYIFLCLLLPYAFLFKVLRTLLINSSNNINNQSGTANYFLELVWLYDINKINLVANLLYVILILILCLIVFNIRDKKLITESKFLPTKPISIILSFFIGILFFLYCISIISLRPHMFFVDYTNLISPIYLISEFILRTGYTFIYAGLAMKELNNVFSKMTTAIIFIVYYYILYSTYIIGMEFQYMVATLVFYLTAYFVLIQGKSFWNVLAMCGGYVIAMEIGQVMLNKRLYNYDVTAPALLVGFVIALILYFIVNRKLEELPTRENLLSKNELDKFIKKQRFVVYTGLILICICSCCYFEYEFEMSAETQKKVIKQAETNYFKAGTVYDQICYLNDITRVCYEGRHDELLKYIPYVENALNSNKNKIPQVAEAVYNIGNYFFIMHDYKNALKYYEEANSVFENVKSIESYYHNIALGSSADQQYSFSLFYSNLYLGDCYAKENNTEKALSQYRNALEVGQKKYNNKYLVSIALLHIGDLYLGLDNYDGAIDYYKQVIEADYKDENIGVLLAKQKLTKFLSNIILIEDTEVYGGNLIYAKAERYYKLAQAYYEKRDYISAEKYFIKALDNFLAVPNSYYSAKTSMMLADIKLSSRSFGEAKSFIDKSFTLIKDKDQNQDLLVDYYILLGTYERSIGNGKRALELHKEADVFAEKYGRDEAVKRKIKKEMAEDYKAMGDYKNALRYIGEISDTLVLSGRNNHQSVYEVLGQYEKEDKESQAELLKMESNLKEKMFQLQKRVTLLVLLMLLIGIYLVLLGQRQKVKAERLLLNILPIRVYNELKKKGKTEPESFEQVTAYFSDIVGFTSISGRLEPKRLIDELNEIFTEFDIIMEKNNCERIKTIGDAYFAVSGMFVKNENHAQNIVQAAIEVIQYLEKRNATADIQWQIRVGIHSGTLTGGVVGKQKYIYDVFSDTVDIVKVMEEYSEPMRINLSESSARLIEESFKIEKRELVELPDVPENMYFVIQ